jgi:predicted nucleic acid-binding protein
MCFWRYERSVDFLVPADVNLAFRDGRSTVERRLTYQISFWDAMVIQAAQLSGADVLDWEDLSDGQKYGSVQVINPLRVNA